MNKKPNFIFYSLFFIASLLAEAYCLATLSEDLVTMIGIGIVVLISGYLLLDSLCYEVEEHLRKLEEEKERRHVELVKLQKGLFMALYQNIENYINNISK